MVVFDVPLPDHYASFLEQAIAQGYDVVASLKSCVVFDCNSIDTDRRNISMTHDINIRQELSDGESIFKQVN